MKQEEINELLSAHLDGESEDPEAVERLLEGEPDVRRRFEILQSQSKALRSLPLPDVAPEFATRVLAGVREERLSRHRRWMPLVLPLAAAFTVTSASGGGGGAGRGTRGDCGVTPGFSNLNDNAQVDAPAASRVTAARSKAFSARMSYDKTNCFSEVRYPVKWMFSGGIRMPPTIREKSGAGRSRQSQASASDQF